MSFATLQEAWGVPTFGVEEIAPEMKQRWSQDEALERAEASERSMAFVRAYLKDAYQRHGVAGIMGLLDDGVLRELRLAALLNFDWLDAHAALFVVMCLCGLWLLADILRR